MIKSLAYLGVTSPNHQEWEHFGPEILGCELAPAGSDGAVRLRFDEVGYRLAIHPGVHNDIAYFGWSMSNQEGAAQLAERISQSGIAVHTATDSERQERGVIGYYWFKDPNGFRHELAWGLMHPNTLFMPGRRMSGFKTGEQGLGHVVLGVPDLAHSDHFYREVMGFHLSDTVVDGPIHAHFYHVNGRHHSLAIARPPITKSCFLHLMIEVNNLDDVGTALDLCKAREIPITRTLGAHTNDRMISFYMHSPAEFRIEYGYGGMEVHDLWEPRFYDKTSIWGHHNQHKELSPFLFLQDNEPMAKQEASVA